jgi:hypothetical protein
MPPDIMLARQPSNSNTCSPQLAMARGPPLRHGQPRTRPLAVPAVTHLDGPRLQVLAGRSSSAGHRVGAHMSGGREASSDPHHRLAITISATGDPMFSAAT